MIIQTKPPTMNKAYWNGHELRGPVTSENPNHAEGCLCDICKSYFDYLTNNLVSLPILLSSGFEGMPVGEVEYVMERKEKEVNPGMWEIDFHEVAIPATPKASEVKKIHCLTIQQITDLWDFAWEEGRSYGRRKIKIDHIGRKANMNRFLKTQLGIEIDKK